MRESRTYGSVRGALSNERPYRVAAICCIRSRQLVARFDICRDAAILPRWRNSRRCTGKIDR